MAIGSATASPSISSRALRLLPIQSRWRIAAIAGYAVASVVALALLVIALFPVGWLEGTIERRLTARYGRPVTIGAIERRDRFSLDPVVLVRDLRVPQPRWAGDGMLARVDAAEVTLRGGALLRMRIEASAIRLRGVRLVLIRAADGRESWRGERGRVTDDADGRAPVLDRLSIVDGTLAYRDHKQDRHLTMRIAADPVRGLIAVGRGTIRRSPVRVALRGAPIAGRSDRRWPFTAAIAGAELAMTARGTMERPLDTDRMKMAVAARAIDLKLIDAIVEAGLFRTFPVWLRADVEHLAPDWTISRLAGTVGRSRLTGHARIGKRDGRTRIDGAIRAATLDFDDLSSPEALAAARAAAARRPLLVPPTRVDLAKIGRTDARLALRVDRLLSRSPSAMRTIDATLTLDRQRLTVAPLRIGLARGAITGQAIVDQRGGGADPLVTLDLRLTDSSIAAIAGGDGTVDGRLDARAYLVGRGETIRSAVGAADGRIGIAARDGALPERFAAALGFDAARIAFAGNRDRAALRCVIVGVAVEGGRGRIAPMIVDTSDSQMRGTGTIAFPGETLAIRLTGAPKRAAILRLPGSVTMTGTLRRPDVAAAPGTASIGNVFRALGRAVTGRQGARATDADCPGLAARVLR